MKSYYKPADAQCAEDLMAENPLGSAPNRDFCQLQYVTATSQIEHFWSHFGEYVGVERQLSSLQTGRSGGLAAHDPSVSLPNGLPETGHSVGSSLGSRSRGIG